MIRVLARLLVAGIFLSGFAWAQEDDSNDAGEAGHGVARISLLNGDVSVQRGDSGEVVAAAVNGPLVAGDQVLTGPSARAEIQFDWANLVRLGTDTQIRLASLENNQFQVQLARGTVTLSVIRDSSGQVEVDTPNMAFRPRERGMYRISVTDDGESEVTVRAGEGDTYTPHGTEAVQAGQTMMVRGPVSDPEFQIVQAIPMDDWDRWNQQRDQRLLSTRSYQYASPDIAGASDLDSYGRWVYVPPYGWVWSPGGVGPDWAPYRNGQWDWLDWYGWSWVSYDPWGWAPYHYGRWFYGAGFGWCWYPGPIYHHYYWRPALVAFFGFGYGGVGVGLGFGSVGWVPLGPHELFHPWYGRGRYVNDVRLTNVTNIRSTYINARVANGISGVGAGAFGQGGRPGALRLNGQERISAIRGGVPVTPTSAGMRMTNRSARIAPAPSVRTQFYSPRSALAAQRGPAPAVRGWRQVPNQSAGQAGRSQGANWRSFGQAPAGASRPDGYRQPSSPDWRSFGQASQAPRTYQGNPAPRYTAPRSDGVRINPPIVRERTQSSGSASHTNSGGHSSGGSAAHSGGGHSTGSSHSSK
jgi:hypothetical protein